jgi:hypothetical protein
MRADTSSQMTDRTRERCNTILTQKYPAHGALPRAIAGALQIILEGFDRMCVLRLRRPSSRRSKLLAATCRHAVYPTRHISDGPIDRLPVQCRSPSRMARICSIKSIALARSSAFSVLRCSNSFCSSFLERRRAGLSLLRRNDSTSRGLFPGRRDMRYPLAKSQCRPLCALCRCTGARQNSFRPICSEI